MKKLIISAIIICFGITGFSQSEKYTGAMKKNISLLDSAMKNGNMKELGNNFERIADAEKVLWLPYYYAAYCSVMSAFMEKDKTKVDAIADKAEELITKSEAAAGRENSEIAVIKSMIASAHMMVDPQSRYMTYGPASGSNIEKAKALDPKNPRPIYLEGQAKFYTPEAFGGGKAVAKPILEKALAMFDTFKPETELHPGWGKTSTEHFLAMANK